MGRNIPLTASEREQTVILYPKLVISGRVTDAETGRPVPKFRVVQGRQVEMAGRDQLVRGHGVEVTSGRYTVPFDEPSTALFVRVEAPGYKPAVSRAFQPTEGSQTFDFALQRAAGLSGLVCFPTASPPRGPRSCWPRERTASGLQSGRFDRVVNFPKITTGPDGRFTFPPTDGKFLLVAVSDAGYADASSDEFAKSGKLVLQPWGQIEGGVRIGARLGSDQEVMFQPYPARRATGIVSSATDTRRGPTSGDASDSTE